MEFISDCFSSSMREEVKSSVKRRLEEEEVLEIPGEKIKMVIEENGKVNELGKYSRIAR